MPLTEFEQHEILIHLFRIYEDAQVSLTKLFTTNTPDAEVIRTGRGDALYNLLDLHPSEAVFYVGGYPKDFTVSDSLHVTFLFKYPNFYLMYTPYLM